MNDLLTLLAELPEYLAKFSAKCQTPTGPDPFDNVILRDKLFVLMEYLTQPEDWAVEMVEVMNNVEFYLSAGTLSMERIISVLEPDQLALMSEIIAAVDSDPSWGN